MQLQILARFYTIPENLQQMKTLPRSTLSAVRLDEREEEEG
jgi:hypothetical protein